ncbi:MAG TPA: prepilin-type N-terminal cleavage/methylation domain-containing protein [Gemmatimonadales bacterium]|jgi:prepilin-type N-terminal cleavage/methylation domain-containing protein|nr:prepilin-type N-terminal cleavage/methylation domain-containing protein [Gemmatimonadales bacterium]
MRRGFTLIEVMVALTLASLVVLLAHRIFSGVADGVGRMDAARTALDRKVNSQRWLAEAFGSLQAGVDSAGSFEGHPDQALFATWQRAPAGGLERRRLRLHQVGATLIADGAGLAPLTLVDSVARIGFDYLLEPGANTAWAREWLSPVSAPLAVRVRIEYLGIPARADTLLLIIGGRG